MAKGCVNGTLEGANYSSPLPMIGLYIAGATFVCLVFMLFDLISAFRHRQVWMPCRLFTLNSVSLSLLSICTKLPVDLTSAMPGAHDQLSKLTATTLLCVAIGFMSPSVGSRSASDSLSNVAALSILVVTVVVNMCIQISTGVVHVYIVEHIIVMVCMLVLLLFMWNSVITGGVETGYYRLNYCHRSVAGEDQGSMLRRLKVFYIIGVALNPQLVAVKNSDSFAMSGFCFLSSAVLLQAMVRSLILKQQLNLCRGNSDYGWSIPMVVTTQFIMVIVGCFALSIRYVGLFSRVNFTMNFRLANNSYSFPLGGCFWRKCCIYLRYYASYIIPYGVNVARIMSTFPAVVYFKYVGQVIYRRELDSRGPDSIEKYRDMCGDRRFFNYSGGGELDSGGCPDCLEKYQNTYGLVYRLDAWITRKALRDIEQWVDRSKSAPLTNLSQLLQRTHPEQLLPESGFTLGPGHIKYPDSAGIDVSPLSLVLLVRIATVSLPLDLTKSLIESIQEVYELVNFIDAAVGYRNPRDIFNPKLAESLAFGDGFVSCLPRIVERSSYSKEELQSLPQLSRTLLIIEHLKDTIDDGRLNFEVGRVTDLISRRGYETFTEVYSFIEQSYVGILHSILAHLPKAIYEEVMECPAGEFEERVRRSLRMLCKVESFHTQVHWLFPRLSRISCLMIDDSSEVDNKSDVGESNERLSSV